MVWIPRLLPILALGLAATCPAGVYNIHLYTDSSPDVADLPSYVESVTGVWTDPDDQAIALWRHAVAGKRQGLPSFEESRGIFDPVMFFNSYGHIHCGYISGVMQALWDAMGWDSYYVELGGHTVAEASWDGGASWHMFDAAMNMYCLNHDGSVASVPEIAGGGACSLSNLLGTAADEPGHQYLYHGAQEAVSNPVNPALPGLIDPWGYRKVADNPVGSTRTLRRGADSFTSGYARRHQWTFIHRGWRYRLGLRPQEHYTRYWSHLGDTEDYYRPDETGGSPDDYMDNVFTGGNLRSNGRWRFRPDLATTGYRAAMYDESGTAHASESGAPGRLLQAAVTGQPAEFVLKMSPANVATSGHVAFTGAVAVEDTMTLLLSVDAGITWEPLWESSPGAFSETVGLPASILGGSYDYFLKFTWTAGVNPGACGLDAVEVETITQLNPRTLPRLVAGSNRVRFDTGPQVESHVLWPPLHDARPVPGYQQSAESWSNIDGGGTRQVYSAQIRPALGAVSAQVTWKFATPGDILGVRFGGRFINYTGGPLDYVRLEHSYDGTSFQEDECIDGATAATLDARVSVEAAAPGPGERAVWMRTSMMSTNDAAYNSTGVHDLLLEVDYEPRDAGFTPVEVTYNWTEHRVSGDVTREHTRLVIGPQETWSLNVDGFRDPTMNFVRLNLQGHGPLGGAVVYGYSDGIDVGPQAGYDKMHYGFRWEDNLAYGLPYTVNRPSHSLNPDSGGELTNGCVVPNTWYTYAFVHDQTAFWDGSGDVVVDFDLGSERVVEGFRVSTHQPDSAFCHPGSIDVAVSVDGVQYQSVGGIDHHAVWRPPGGFVPWEMEDGVDFAALPATGKLAFPFWIVPDQASTARYVRCTLTPLSGRGMGLSEIQILSHVTVEDWPDREILVPEGSILAVPVPGPGGTPVESLQLSRSSPNPFHGETRAVLQLDRPQPVRAEVFSVDGRLMRVLVDDVLNVGSHEIVWGGTDRAGRPAAAGIYFMVVRGETGRVTRKLLRLP